MSGLMIRHRETVGTLGLLLFLTFLLTAWFGALGAGLAHAQEEQTAKSVTVEAVDGTDKVKLIVELAQPITDDNFNSTVALVVEVNGQTVFDETTVNLEVYKEVNGAVYSVYFQVYIAGYTASDLASLIASGKLAFGANEVLESVYLTFESPPPPPSGGGGTVTPPPTPQETEDLGTVTVDDNTATYTVEADKVEEALADDDVDVLVIELPGEIAGQEVNAAEIVLPANVVEAIANSDKPLVVVFGDLMAEFPADAFDGVNQSVTIAVQPVSSSAPVSGDLVPAGPVYEITATTASGQVTFAARVQLALSYDPDSLGNTPSWKLGVYRFNESTGQWDFVGGRVDTTNRKVIASLSSFSRYTVLAYDKTFDDIQGHWAQLDIEHMASKHVVRGMTDSTYEPEGAVTRAQFAALLVRALNVPAANPVRPTFQDLGSSHWAYAEVEAAVQAGLVRGVGDNRFEPERRITRQEMAAMLVRAAEWAGRDLDPGNAAMVLSAYSDAGSIADWATEAVSAAIRANLMSGRSGSEFVPLGTATRAEAATVIKRLMNMLNML